MSISVLVLHFCWVITNLQTNWRTNQQNHEQTCSLIECMSEWASDHLTSLPKLILMNFIQFNEQIINQWTNWPTNWPSDKWINKLLIKMPFFLILFFSIFRTFGALFSFPLVDIPTPLPVPCMNPLKQQGIRGDQQNTSSNFLHPQIHLIYFFSLTVIPMRCRA